MFVKALAATSLVAAPVTASSDIAYLQYPQVRMVRCDEGSGSAVQTTKGWVSVAHVTRMTNCKIDGNIIFLTEQNDDLDFSRMVAVVPRNVRTRISCEGFRQGEYYWATGYAKGLPYQTNVRILALGMKGWRGFDALIGRYTVIPGMSGGAIWDSSGRIVGMVNAYNPGMGFSFSRSLSETSLCSDQA